MEKPNTRIKLSAPFLTIIPTVHFLVQLIKRSFDLTAIIPAYIYLVKNIKDIKTSEVVFLVNIVKMVLYGTYHIMKKNSILIVLMILYHFI